MMSLRKWPFWTHPCTHPIRLGQVSLDPPIPLTVTPLFMKRGWVFQTVPMRTPQKRSFKILQQFLWESGASIPPETMMHFPPCFRFPPYFRIFFDFLKNLIILPFPKKFLFFFYSLITNF